MICAAPRGSYDAFRVATASFISAVALELIMMAAEAANLGVEVVNQDP